MIVALLLAMWLGAGAVWAAHQAPADVRVRRRLVRSTAVANRSVPLLPRRAHPGAAVVELCTAIADELRGGRLPSDALCAAAAATGAGDLVVVATLAARGGQPVALALVRDAEAHPGARGLRMLAACWQVAEQHGAGLAVAVDRVADALRAEDLARRRVAVELAAPRATARLLAGLPALGLLMGTAMGANPIRVLLGTGWGLGLLVVGVVLDVVGLDWMGRIARAAERVG